MVTPQAPIDRDDVAFTGLAQMARRLTFLPVFVAPVALVTLALVMDDGTAWRRAGFAVLGVLGIGASARILIAGVHRQLVWRLAPVKMIVAITAVVVVVGLTGGMESPFLPVMVPMTLVSALLAGPRSTAILVVIEYAAIWTYTLLATLGHVPGLNPAVFGGGTRAGHDDALLYTAAGVLTFALPWVTFLGGLLRRTFLDLFVRTVEARDEAVRTHAEHAHALTALSGEIAHELKNPLASVKGLAALIARDVPEGKVAERLSVLRREVDRMQATLDEFLNFSRPLVPLHVRPVDLQELATSIVELHEGMAREHGLTLALEARPAPVACDPRKVGQVLINLVQNAIEASPRGAAVEVEVTADGGGSHVEVRDRGRGLDPELGERVFEPGVTTKERGSGLGLAIARGLARQHGGELVLAPREGGGAVARLSLPTARSEAA